MPDNPERSFRFPRREGFGGRISSRSRDGRECRASWKSQCLFPDGKLYAASLPFSPKKGPQPCGVGGGLILRRSSGADVSARVGALVEHYHGGNRGIAAERLG